LTMAKTTGKTLTVNKSKTASVVEDKALVDPSSEGTAVPGAPKTVQVTVKSVGARAQTKTILARRSVDAPEPGGIKH